MYTAYLPDEPALVQHGVLFKGKPRAAMFAAIASARPRRLLVAGGVSYKDLAEDVPGQFGNVVAGGASLEGFKTFDGAGAPGEAPTSSAATLPAAGSAERAAILADGSAAMILGFGREDGHVSNVGKPGAAFSAATDLGLPELVGFAGKLYIYNNSDKTKYESLFGKETPLSALVEQRWKSNPPKHVAMYHGPLTAPSEPPPTEKRPSGAAPSVPPPPEPSAKATAPLEIQPSTAEISERIAARVVAKIAPDVSRIAESVAKRVASRVADRVASRIADSIGPRIADAIARAEAAPRQG